MEKSNPSEYYLHMLNTVNEMSIDRIRLTNLLSGTGNRPSGIKKHCITESDD